MGDLTLEFSTPLRRCGATYFASVTMRNCAGAERVVTSSGVRVCCDEPTQVALKLVASDGFSGPLPSVDNRSMA